MDLIQIGGNPWKDVAAARNKTGHLNEIGMDTTSLSMLMALFCIQPSPPDERYLQR